MRRTWTRGFRLGDHSDKSKILERVIVSPGAGEQRHWWGSVEPAFGPHPSSICLVKGDFRVRIEGWLGDAVLMEDGWERAAEGICGGRPEIVVWSPCGTSPRGTRHGPVPRSSGHPDSFWAEYVGPFTRGVCRAAGPFG